MNNDYVGIKLKKLEEYKKLLKILIAIIIISGVIGMAQADFLLTSIVLAVILMFAGIVYLGEYSKLNKSIKDLKCNNIDYELMISDIKYKPFQEYKIYMGSKAMYYGGAIVAYKDVIWSYGKNTITTTRYYGVKIGDRSSKTMVIRTIAGKEYAEALTPEKWLWFFSTYANLFSNDLILGYGLEQQRRYDDICNKNKNDYTNYNSYSVNMSRAGKKKEKEPMTFKKFLLILAVCCLVMFILIIPVINPSNDNSNKTSSNNKNTSYTVTSENVKLKHLSYNGEEIGTVSEESIGNELSIYRFDYVNFENYNVKIKFEFDSGYLSKTTEYLKNDVLSLADGDEAIGIAGCVDLDVEFIETCGVEVYFEELVKLMEEDYDDVELEKRNDKYVIYYKDPSIGDNLTTQSILIYDMNDAYILDFLYAVRSKSQFDGERLDLVISTVERYEED